MYKVISKSRLPVTISVTNPSGLESVLTLPGRGSGLTYHLTESIRRYTSKNLLRVQEITPSQITPDLISSDNISKEQSVVTESISITRTSPDDAKVIDPEVDSEVTEVTSETSEEVVELSTPTEDEKIYDEDDKALVMEFLKDQELADLKALATELGVTYGSNIGKDTLMDRLYEQRFDALYDKFINS